MRVPPIAWHRRSAISLGKRRGLLDAVVFSGGEPTLQRDLANAIGEVRGMGFRVGAAHGSAAILRLQALLPRI